MDDRWFKLPHLLTGKYPTLSKSNIYSNAWNRDDIENINEEYRRRREFDKIHLGKDWIEEEKPVYTKEILENGLKNLKPNKAAGPDKIKAEVYQALGEKELIKEILVETYDKILNEQEIPEYWKKSRTKMIPKKKKTQAKDMRPIAITNISYKLYMSHIGEEIEKHIEVNNLAKGNQVGFTKGGRTEYNHFMLQYIVDKAQRNKEKLIVITLDFKKAFDSTELNWTEQQQLRTLRQTLKSSRGLEGTAVDINKSRY